MPPDAVRINENENPLGPCPEALEAIYQVAKFGGRYSPHNEAGELVKTSAALEGLKPEYITAFAGSSDPLHRAVHSPGETVPFQENAPPGQECLFRHHEQDEVEVALVQPVTRRGHLHLEAFRPQHLGKGHRHAFAMQGGDDPGRQQGGDDRGHQDQDAAVFDEILT
ncbi:hypothetical protein B4Q13_25160, partial [Lacticaseibacillus rhamnosus]